MASFLPPVSASQPNPQNPYAAFNFQPSPAGSVGDILAGLGMGLLQQGPSTTPISPFTGLGAGIGNAQQMQNQRLQRQGMQAQNVLAGQAYRKGQQDLAAGNLTMAQSIMRMNFLRRRQGLPDLTADDLANNPSLTTGGAPGGVPGGPSATPSAAPTASPYVTTSGQPATAGNMQVTPNGPGSYSTNVTPAGGQSAQPPQPMQGGSAAPDPSDPYGFNAAVNDALFISPEFANTEITAAKSSPQYIFMTKMAEQGMVLGQDGKSWVNADGTVASKAQVASAVAGAQAWAGVGPHNTEALFKGGITPTTVNRQTGVGPDGKPIFSAVNTNQVDAANPSLGLPAVDPTNADQVKQLSAASSGGAAAGAAPYDFMHVPIPNPAVPGSTIDTLMSKEMAAAYMAAIKSQSAPAAAPQPPNNAAAGAAVGAAAGGSGPVATPPAPAVPGIPGQVTLGPADQAMLPDLVKNLNERQLAAQGANDSLVSLGELRKALNGLPTGPGTENANVASAAFQRLGIDINSILPAGVATDPVKYAIALKNINQLGMGLARSNFPGGRITNADLTLALTATPNFFNSPGANKELLGNIEGIQRLKIERADYDRQWLTQHGGQPSLSMEDSWKQHVMGMKNVPDLLKQGFLSFSDQAANPNAAKSPQIDLPPGAVNSGIGSDGQTYYTYKNPNGAGYYTGDKNGKPVQ